MESHNEFKNTDIRNHTCYFVGDIIRVEDIGLDIILLYETSCENISIYDIQNLLWVQNHYVLDSMKYMELLKFMMEQDI